ncbi:cyclin-dependent kinase 3-like [Chenopodium quinoa]|uniref:cyclin-dependent kinase 3-like n=1 Tax=Chenopodium quinoa TaxID=63459 RepID=UPI000B790B9E|nr:cyclin-dependent kinase 3-like [Chenopodium quinoa]
MANFLPPSVKIPSTFFPEVGSKFHDFTIVEHVGAGGFGNVYLIKREEESFALKLIPVAKGELSKAVIREISLLYDVEHQNIVRLITVFVERENLCLIMEYVGADLQGVSCPIEDNDKIKDWMYQILCAVSYLHERNIVHRDLKPGNILRTEDGRLKQADFGLSRGHLFPGAQITPLEATPEFSAPELLLGSGMYTTAIDMWSVGCIFYVMIVGENPFSSYAMIANMFQSNPPSDHKSTVILDTIFRLLGTPTELSWPGVTQFPNE